MFSQPLSCSYFLNIFFFTTAFLAYKKKNKPKRIAENKTWIAENVCGGSVYNDGEFAR